MSSVRILYDNDFNLANIKLPNYDVYLSKSPLIEDYHFIACAGGILIVTDLCDNNFCVHPSSGIVDIYCIMKFLSEDSRESISYCIEELYTVNEFDDEYCVTINREFNSSKEMIRLKSNNQKHGYIFDLLDFKHSIVEFSQELIDRILIVFPSFIISPIKEEIDEMRQKISIALSS